jgi:hypothetical protein
MRFIEESSEKQLIPLKAAKIFEVEPVEYTTYRRM